MKKTSLKLKYRPSFRSPSFGTLLFCVTRHRKTTTSTTPYVLNENEWNETSQSIVFPENISSKRRKELSSLRGKLKKELSELLETISILELRGDYSSSELMKCFRDRQQGQQFCAYINSKVEILHLENKFGTAHSYQYAAQSFLKYLGNTDIHIGKINSVLIEDYERYLFSNGKSKNTVSCYMRSLRAAYNSALYEKIIVPDKTTRKPFSGVFTGNAKTLKRAIGVEAIEKIMSVNLTENKPAKQNISNLSFSRDLFLFSFYTQGMSFSDMVNLKKENIRSGKIVYQRQKTGQTITIELENCMTEIINRYAKDNSPYVFPVLNDLDKDIVRWKHTQLALSSYNRNLSRLGALSGIDEKLTSYVSRHSWATIASREGIPISTISRGMGHESEKTTRIYISRADYSDVGLANRLILSRFVGNTNAPAIFT